MKQPPRKVDLVTAADVREGDEIAFNARAKYGIVSLARRIDGRVEITTSVSAPRLFEPGEPMLRREPKPPTIADQRKPR